MNIIMRLKIYWLLAIMFTSTTISWAQIDSTTTIGYCSPMPAPEIIGDSLASGVGEKNALWDVGQTIRVRFLDGSPFLKQKVMQYTAVWEQYANIKFNFVQSGSSDIRISFAIKGVYQSQIGTYAKGVPANRPTMYLGFSESAPESEFRRLILHEFGHAIGLHHEHLHPENNIQWNKPAVYQWFLINQGWSRENVDFNLFQTRPKNTVHYCEYNSSSIMHYFVLQEFTLNNFSVGNNTNLSTEDKNFIQKLYPTGVRGNPICGDCTDCLEQYRLVTIIRGEGTITATPSNGNNATCSTSCAGTYDTGTVVQLSATPDKGYRFVRWSGANCTNNTSTSCSVTINNNEVVSAIFEKIPSNALTIKVEGSGTIQATPTTGNLQNCTLACIESYEFDQLVILTATPDTGYEFVKWSGTACNNSTATSCSVKMNQSHSITAVFEEMAVSTKNLTVSVNGNGTIDLLSNGDIVHTCTNSCTYNAPERAPLELIAKPATGHRFVEWQGDVCNRDMNTTCPLTLSRDLNVQAVFEPIPPTSNQLTVQIVGSGTVAVSDNSQIEICEETCELNYPRNSSIELWANPADGYRFDSWVGIACNDSPVAHCLLELTSSQGIMAIFEPITTNDVCINFSVTSNSMTCSTGSISVKIAEGIAPFTIQVNGPISGDATVNNKSFRIEDFTAGAYTIHIQDAAGCETTEQFSIANTCGQGNLSDVVTARSKASNDSNPIPMVALLSDSPTIALNTGISELGLAEGIKISSIEDITTTYAAKTPNTNSVNQTSNASTDFQRCGSTAYMAALLKDTERAQQQAEKEQFSYGAIDQARANCNTPVILPIAIHFQNIAHTNRACLEAIAQRQIQVLNEDFQGTNKEINNWTSSISRFFPGIDNGETCVEFCIATQNHPSGFGLQNGDLAVTINQTRNDFDKRWSGYINIFVKDIGDDILGYAPIGGDGDGDGVIISLKAFGKGSSCGVVSPTAPYHLGRTLTHELGHYFFLNHIWGEGCGQDEGIADTPNSEGPHFGCPRMGLASCGSTDLHINYMDYTNDACLYMFTAGQSAYMENYIARYLAHVIENGIQVCPKAQPIEELKEYNLAVAVTGAGTITATSGKDFACTATCSTNYEAGQVVQLTATPKQGYQFMGWTGTSCNNTSSTNCIISMNSDQEIVGVFEPIAPSTNQLTIYILGEGTVETTVEQATKSCDNVCTVDYTMNSMLNLVAKPATGYRFSQWLQGACNNSTETNCELVLAQDQRVIAIFEEVTTNTACLDFTATTTNTACDRGSLSVKIEAGTAPYSIKITGPLSGDATTSNTSFRIEGFPAGDYEITLTDAAQCEMTEQFKVANTCGRESADESTYRISNTNATVPVLSFSSNNTHTHEIAGLQQCPSRPMSDEELGGLYQGNSDRNRLWDVGQVIRVRFMRNSFLRNRIIQGAREWERYANVKFQFVTSGPADIRIDFDPEANNQSWIGTEALTITDQNKWTMNFSLKPTEGTERISWVVLHEFGHALGLLHEHLHPEHTIQWDKEAVYAYNSGSSRGDVDINYFNLPPKDAVYLCTYDPKSVMHYFVYNSWTLNDFEVPQNNPISEEDKRFMGQLYPFSGIRNTLACGFCSDGCGGEKRLSIKVTGGGSVVSVEEGGQINQCHSDCIENYEEGTNIVLNAIPDDGYEFVGWQGGGCKDGTTGCSLTLNSHTTVTAIFEEINVTTNKELKIRVDGEGSVIVNAANTSNTCTRSCTFIYTGPLAFQLQAVPAAGYRFVRWEGSYCSNTLPDCAFEINVNETIRAIFEEDVSCLDFTITPTNSKCNTGMISVAITEGVAPFTIAISGPVSGDATTNNKSFRIEDLSAGDYNILLVDAMGCETTQDFSIANTCLKGDRDATARSKMPTGTLKLIEDESMATAAILEVAPNYPNPFREQTSIPFTLTESGTVNLEIFHSNGQKIYQSEDFFEVGSHQIELGANILQKSGLYIYHFKVDEELVIGKMIRL